MSKEMGTLQSPWTKTKEEIASLSGAGGGKVPLAQQVGIEITQSQLETGMSEINNAIKQCWNNAYKD